MHIRQAELSSLEAIGEAFVVDAEAVQDGRLEVVDVDRVLLRVEAEVVGAAEGHAWLDAAAGHPDRESFAMVIASVFFAIGSALRVRGAAELAAPDDKRVVEHAALLQVLDQGSRGLVDVAGHLGQLVLQAAVVVPVAVIELDEAHAFLGESAGEEGIAGERARSIHVRSVAFHDRLAFAGEVHELRDAGLHTVGHLGLADAGRDLRVAGGGEVEAIQFVGSLKQGLALISGEAFGVAKVEHRFTGSAELDALVGAGQETAAPESGKQALAGALFVGRDEHDERRQVIVHAAEAVVGPCAHARATRQLTAGLEEGDRRVVVDGLGVHRAHDADLVSDAADVGQQFADLGAGLAVTGEFESARLAGEAGLRGHHARDALAAADGVGQVFVELPFELGLGIQQVEVRRSAGLKEADDALGLGSEVRQAGQSVDVRVGGGAGRSAPAEQMGEGAGAEAEAGLLQELAP